jgi:hypothetical protein
MHKSDHYNELMFRHELLKARVEVRDHYLKCIIREVYENIGQVLSLVRIQLAMIPTENSGIEKKAADETGHLVGQVIRDLRSLCEKFYLGSEKFTPDELCQALESECRLAFPGATLRVGQKPVLMDFNITSISFYIVKTIFTLIRENGELLSLQISGDDKHLYFDLKYAGCISWKDLSNHVELMGGSLEVQKDSSNIKLTIPHK